MYAELCSQLGPHQINNIPVLRRMTMKGRSVGDQSCHARAVTHDLVSAPAAWTPAD